MNNNKNLNITVIVLILLAVVVNNLEALYTFKMIFNGVVMVALVVIGCVRLYKLKKK